LGHERYEKCIQNVNRKRKRQLQRGRYSWEDNIKTNVIEIVYEGVEWIEVAQDRVQ
jgi:hypothetical protein